jgi:hypothetical protein
LALYNATVYYECWFQSWRLVALDRSTDRRTLAIASSRLAVAVPRQAPPVR